jgi:hypothetical protein
MPRRPIRVLRGSIQEVTGEKFHPTEGTVHHKTMAGWTLVGTETADAVSGQGTTDHIPLTEASGVLTSDPVVPARLAWKERSVALTESAVVVKSAAASETAAVDGTGSVKANDPPVNPENRAKAADASAALGTRGDLQDVRTAEAEAEELQTTEGRGHAILKTQAKETQM